MQIFSVLLASFMALAAASRNFPQVALPANWEKISDSVDPLTKLQLRVALFPRDAKALENSLLEISTPGSKRFRQYLKKDQITAIVGRDDKDIQKLTEVFTSQGLKVTSVHPHKDWIFVEGPAAVVEKFFQCKLSKYQHKVRESERIGELLISMLFFLEIFYHL